MKVGYKMRKVLYLIVIFLLLNPANFLSEGRAERSREEVREEYLSVLNKKVGSVYVNEPSAQAPYAAGSLTEESISSALSCVNFIRWLAGLEAVEADAALSALSQHGAVLSAACGSLSHSPEKPGGMDEAFYETGREAAASCNLAMFNWFEEGILRTAVEQFARDDAGDNRYVLGHRRWLLYPGMKYTGFGLAQDAEGRSYAAMYVMDASNEEADYDMICWPSAGAFPAEMMGAQTPWSVSLNPDRYDLDKSALGITLTEEKTGARFVFDVMEETSQEAQYFVLGGGRMGDGPAYIFRPDLQEYGELMYGYQQNQVWTVEITGAVKADGTYADKISYTVEMISLTPIDPAAVEMAEAEAQVRAGESIRLQAQVIPDWADDLSLRWRSENEAVAVVDAFGTVTGVSEGTCMIVAESVNGREDRTEVTVFAGEN